MDKKISIIYAFRDRDAERIRLSMESLRNQNIQNFEVLFIDYGSHPKISGEIERTLADFEFCRYFYLHTSQMLWNKSRALNFGIKNARCSSLFIADVDLIFSPEATEFLESHILLRTFKLFTMGYLSKQESLEVLEKNNFKELEYERTGNINGMILAPSQAFYEISGYDEFYHFYGSEDVDLYARMRNAGYKEEMTQGVYFYHNWHASYQKSQQKGLTQTPRIANAMRINEQHYFYNSENNVLTPHYQQQWGEEVEKQKVNKLLTPEVVLQIDNKLAGIEHFIYEGIKAFKNKTIEVRIEEADYYDSLKHKTKKLLGKQTQSYISLKEINDMLLKRIVFEYRNYNYSYKISSDLKTIIFKIEL